MKQALTYVAAGVAALVTALSLQYFSKDPTRGLGTFLKPLDIRIITGVVFFAVFILLWRMGFNQDDLQSRGEVRPTDFSPGKTPQETSDDMARVFSGVTDETSRKRAILGWLSALPSCTALVPLTFYLRFGTIGPLGWGLTVFFDVYCLLWALGLYFRPLTAYHSPIALRGDWKDRIGAFWLVGCAFGPLFGWLVTEIFPVTQDSWRWLYGLRLFLAGGIPVLLALPLLRYVRGKAARIALPLLVILTLIPASTAMMVSQDLWEGPSLLHSEWYLKHTARSLGAGS